MTQNVKNNTQQNLSSGFSNESGCTNYACLHADGDQYLSLSKVTRQATIGDILEFQRGEYIDYALYLGGGNVMSFNLREKHSTEAKVLERTLEEVCHGGKARIRGHEDVAQALFNVQAKSPDVIVYHAKSYRNKTVPHEFDLRNSEYYCTLWRYGVGFSTQAAQQAWLPAEFDVGGICTGDNTRSNLFGPEGYAKYKQLSMTDRGERLENQY